MSNPALEQETFWRGAVAEMQRQRDEALSSLVNTVGQLRVQAMLLAETKVALDEASAKLKTADEAARRWRDSQPLAGGDGNFLL